MDNNIKKILITGSAGLVGSACADFFTQKGWEVIGIDNNARSKNLGTPTKNIELELDFTDAGKVFELFRQHKFDAIIHAGAQASHDWSNDHVIEDFMTNAFGTVLLLEATRQHSPNAVFVYVSTDKVYGENMKPRSTVISYNLPFKESLGLDFAGHRSPFGCSKTAADIYTQEYAHTFGLKTGVFRPGCITGRNHEGAELHGFLAYLAKCIRTGTPYKIFGFKGKQVRDQIHANDLANAFYHFIQNPRAGEVYNIGGGPERSVSVLEAIELIDKEVKKDKKELCFIIGCFTEASCGGLCAHHDGAGNYAKKSWIETIEFIEQRKGDRIWDVHDVSKFRSHYPNWNYEYDLQGIIKDVCSKEL